MSTTIGVPAEAGSPKESPVPPGKSAARKPSKNPIWQGIAALASLRLTVALFALSIVLVFFGTIAQIDNGVWTVVDQYFRSWYVWIPFQLIAEFGMKFFEFPESTVWHGSFPFPGGWLIGGVMLANLFAAHLTRFKLSWRRSGVVILHLGVILLMAGELITGLYAVESRMVLQVGESRNYIDHSRKIELAFTDDATHRTATIPQGMLTPGQTIVDPNLPVDVQVLERFKNTTLEKAIGGDDSDTVVSVLGGRYHVVPAAEGSGVKGEQQEDVPGVRVRLLKKGTNEVAAERLYSLWEYRNGPAARQFMTLPAQVAVDGKTYTIELRNERIYKPFTIKLLKFEHTKYVGTETPKDYASTVQLVDPESGDDREVRIWMNHPLYHRDETFYQSGTMASETPTGEKRDTGTVLQVVKNPGWRLPYASCIVITLGMLIHFGMNLAKFTGRIRGLFQFTGNGVRRSGSRAAFYFPLGVTLILGLYVMAKMLPKQETYKEFDLTAFGSIPVVDGGRAKPLDSIARTTMLFISGRSDWQDTDGESRPAILWLLEVLAAGDPHASPIADYRVFRVDNERLLDLLKLENRDGLRYSWNEISKAGDKYETVRLAAQAREEKKAEGERVPPDGQDLYYGKVLELGNRLHVYEQLAMHKKPTLIPSEKGSAKWLTLEQIDSAAGQRFFAEASQEARQELEQLMQALQEKGIKLDNPRVQMGLERELERRTQVAIRRFGESHRSEVNPAAEAFGKILTAYRENRPKGFAEAIEAYKSNYVYPLNPEFRDTAKFEQEFNGASPFINAAILYVIAGVFMSLSWMFWTRPLWTTATRLVGLALVIHFVGLLGRMYIMGRPLVFVTNLYSTALLIGCGGVAFCLLMEFIFKNGLALEVGIILGAITAKIAHHLSTDGSDTLGTLQAVLDTNLWLASHVTTVTLGYAATYVAGFLGIAYILWGLCLNTLTREKHIAVGNMIYGVVCFATLLSFVGTVLGGIWADQSWGRFWGWDPKENGAVLIVIWNALILHARWCGLVKQRGVAVLTIVGIMITTWSYFGTNQLGVGLHAYGFSKTLAEGCKWTWIACLVLIAIGLTPLKYWRSFAGTGLPKPERIDELEGSKFDGKPKASKGNRESAHPRSKQTGKNG